MMPAPSTRTCVSGRTSSTERRRSSTHDTSTSLLPVSMCISWPAAMRGPAIVMVLLTCQMCVGNSTVSSIISCLFLANCPMRCQQCIWLKHCLPTLMYGCEVSTLTDRGLHKLNCLEQQFSANIFILLERKHSPTAVLL